jgi:hypothetical protein
MERLLWSAAVRSFEEIHAGLNDLSRSAAHSSHRRWHENRFELIDVTAYDNSSLARYNFSSLGQPRSFSAFPPFRK